MTETITISFSLLLAMLIVAFLMGGVVWAIVDTVRINPSKGWGNHD